MKSVPIDVEDAYRMGLKSEQGYWGIFTRNEYPGALKNGTRIRKTNSEPNDHRNDGDAGTVIGSIGAPEVGVMYFIEWDQTPRVIIGVTAQKVIPWQ